MLQWLEILWSLPPARCAVGLIFLGLIDEILRYLRK